MGETALIIGLLWLAAPVVVPIVLAFYIAFVLVPPCNWLERLGAPRWLATTAVVGAALAGVGVLGSMFLAQAVDLAAQLNRYSSQMSEKLAGIRSGRMQVLNDLSHAFAELSRRIDPETAAELSTPVRVVSGGGSTLGRLSETIGPILQPAAVALVVFVMTVFMVARREDLRGRLIQLVGPQNVTVTTRTLSEAVTRVGHLLLTQVYINAGFGALIAFGLYLIGIPYALLWGVLAGLLRFVPLLGAWVAGFFPALVAFAVFPGWREMLLTIGFFLITDLVLGNFVEPLVLGRRTGVSALALLVMALLWTWLWGPLGLLLATPITVCAAVVGRHVPGLEFLATALGDEPGLHAEVDFYQRTLANKATKDALLFAKRRVAATNMAQTFDEILVPALSLLSTDRRLGTINDATAERVAKDIADIALRLEVPSRKPARTAVPMLGIAAESLLDGPVLNMLRATLSAEGQQLAMVESADRGDALARALELKPSLICVAGLPPAGNVNARFFCRRLRAELPSAVIVALIPAGDEKHSLEAAARLREAGATVVTHSVREAAQLLLEHADVGAAAPSSRRIAFAG